MHFVGLALQVVEEAPDAVPLALPVAAPAGIAFEHPVALLGAQVHPGCVARDAGRLGVLQQLVLALLVGRGLDGFDGPGAQGAFGVWDHQPPIDADHPAKAAAGGAGAERRIEGKMRRHRLGVAQVALGAVQASGKTPDAGLGGRLGRRG